MAPSPNVEITYCRLCNWLLRAGWTAQELLSTFAAELGSVTLIPDDTGGVFEVKVDGRQIWSRKDHGRFPEMKELKQLIRDEEAHRAVSTYAHKCGPLPKSAIRSPSATLSAKQVCLKRAQGRKSLRPFRF